MGHEEGLVSFQEKALVYSNYACLDPRQHNTDDPLDLHYYTPGRGKIVPRKYYTPGIGKIVPRNVINLTLLV